MSDSAQPSGPDLAQGIPLSDLGDGSMLLGHVGTEAVLVARRGKDLFAVGATCTHWGGPLAEGLMVDDTVRCPWHHACFSLRTGEPLRAPALDPIARWSVDVRDGRVYVGERMERAAPPTVTGAPESVVIVGGGAAGNAAAEMLRREGYAGRLTMLSADESGPYDRPNLSKNYLAGNAPEAWIPLRSPEFYRDRDIDLKLGAHVTAIDTANRQVRLVDGSHHAYDALLLATGAEPARLALPGGDLPHVHYLRTLADCRALIARASESKQAVVIGASFIGLEVAASLRARDIE
ncbi:MAG TPA: FAD-dependent oxidoreductase, partial [Tepidiformaceae bacterium]|nr:FAD-dependent oxidoreductase [Tepidiformaceae bacterium]